MLAVLACTMSYCIKILELSLIYTTQDFCSGSMFIRLTLTTYAGVSFKAGFIHWAQGKLIASSRHSVCQGAAQKTVCEKIKKRGEMKRCLFNFLSAVFCTESELTERKRQAP